jgi:putative DNA methylase
MIDRPQGHGRTPSVTQNRKLIEVSLPLEDINRESAREKSIRHGHPSTLHLWWSRKPTAAARAVLFAQLVDDPSSHPDRFPTEEDQRVERERLHDIIRRLVVWENVGDERLFREAHEEILKSTGGKPPAILDPFAGGGTIPLEAQRLGLEAHASDLNPVAVLINKALIEIPPMFAGRPPVFPGAADSKMGDWPRATGLAEDVRRYGAWMRDRAEERLGHLYPKATLPDESKATVIAWIWARTVTCPNPACGVEMPLTSKWSLGKKKGKEAYVVPEVVPDADAASGRRVAFTIGHGAAGAPTKDEDGTVGRTGATCVACGTAVELKYIRAEGKAGRMGAQLMAVVAEGNRRRVYLSATEAHVATADLPQPASVPEGDLPAGALGFRVQGYGMTHWADLFTSRQLTALTTFGDLVAETRGQVLQHALAAGLPKGAPLSNGGLDATAYADAVATYLALGLSRMVDRHSMLTTWDSGPKKEYERSVFSRHTIQMAWDFVESNPFGEAGADFSASVEWMCKALHNLMASHASSVVAADAAACSYDGVVISTDPPYYDNIGYSDLSDFFYVWLRRSLRDVHPALFSTILVPKAEELVANPCRHGGKDAASQFFEEGFGRVFARARESATDDFPITVYYAFKQQELQSEGVSSTGWATMLEGMIRAGWTITATWPVRSELGNRMRSLGSNALASSIVLALRPRHATAETTSRRGFLAALKADLPEAIAAMRQGSIAPVDYAQATIGPGMAVFSRYTKVIESDGSAMTVRTALTLINRALDEVLADQDGDLDADTRFCIMWYEQFGWSRERFGLAEGIALRVNRSVEGIARGGVLTAKEGWVSLTRPAELPVGWDPLTDDRVSVWEATCHLARAITTVGLDDAARLLAAIRKRPEIDVDAVQRLAIRLYRLAETKHPEDAGLFNALGTEWAALTDAASTRRVEPAQGGLDLEGLT